MSETDVPFVGHERLSKIDANSSPETLRKIYDAWARKYDADTTGHLGYVGPVEGARKLAEWVPDKKAKILDAGAGTGMSGAALHEWGYSNLDALDISAEMLVVAEEKGAYNHLFQDNMAGPEPLKLPSNDYDAILVVGTFTKGHVHADALDELIRVTKPNGLIVFTLRPDMCDDPAYGFTEKLPKIEAEKKVELLSKTTEKYHLKHDKINCYMYVYKVLK
ncbi:methyltransferase-like protein 27 [Lingula anatina]|uniref:Methyltransferase-like protein 27 n=1 Tax=Lingula anatina TaxID=7574 RepID=A0A1S3JTV7_LINAN|nr:methyltransferase-like protein 27 [Lingula anatina]XP_013413763.1 methyltransferase-like protein 27 [Lingula anatina]|eukprot:XP_013413762.1 methyltransferase-like protein 27 [Lingula anatina]